MFSVSFIVNQFHARFMFFFDYLTFTKLWKTCRHLWTIKKFRLQVKEVKPMTAQTFFAIPKNKHKYSTTYFPVCSKPSVPLWMSFSRWKNEGWKIRLVSDNNLVCWRKCTGHCTDLNRHYHLLQQVIEVYTGFSQGISDLVRMTKVLSILKYSFAKNLFHWPFYTAGVLRILCRITLTGIFKSFSNPMKKSPSFW